MIFAERRKSQRKIYVREKLFSTEMQTFSIFLSSGTDEQKNVKSFIFSSRNLGGKFFALKLENAIQVSY